MMAVCPEHPMWDQNPIFTPLSETTSIPTPFICGVHPRAVCLGCAPPKLPVRTSARAGVRTKTFSPVSLENVLADQEMLELPEHAKYGKSELRKRGTHMAKNALCDWLEPRGLCETKAEWKLGTISPECIVLIKFSRKKMNFWRYFAVKLRV